MGQRWLSIVEYARTYSVSDMTVRRRIKNGKLNAQLREGKYYIPVEYEKVAETSSFTNQFDKPQVISKTLNGGVRDDEPRKSVVPTRIPTSISSVSSQNIGDNVSDLVDSCNRAVGKISALENHLQSSYANKISSLEASLKLKENEVFQLKQKVEDLEMLVKMLDNRTT